MSFRLEYPLNSGRLLVNGSDFYIGDSSNQRTQLARLDQVPSTYIHPSTKQCNYSVDLSNINASRLQGYTYQQIINTSKSTEIVKIAHTNPSGPWNTRGTQPMIIDNHSDLNSYKTLFAVLSVPSGNGANSGNGGYNEILIGDKALFHIGPYPYSNHTVNSTFVSAAIIAYPYAVGISDEYIDAVVLSSSQPSSLYLKVNTIYTWYERDSCIIYGVK